MQGWWSGLGLGRSQPVSVGAAAARRHRSARSSRPATTSGPRASNPRRVRVGARLPSRHGYGPGRSQAQAEAIVMAKQTNIRRRGTAWVVVIRVNGKQVWRSFPTRDAAEVFLEQIGAERRNGTYRAPAQSRVPRGGGGVARARRRRRRHPRPVEGDDPARLQERARRSPPAGVRRPAARRGDGRANHRVAAGTDAGREAAAADGREGGRGAARDLRAGTAGVRGFPRNPVTDVERLATRYGSAIDFYLPFRRSRVRVPSSCSQERPRSRGPFSSH